MKLYITDLSAYNAGHLIGKWVELPMDEDELKVKIKTILIAGQKACNDTDFHEEIFITDYEADIAIEEYDDVYKLNDLAEALAEFSDYDLLKLKYLSSEGYDEKAVIETGIGSYDVEIYDFRGDSSFTDTFELLAMQFVDDGLFGEIPESLESYINYEKIARDLRIDYSEFESRVIGRG